MTACARCGEPLDPLAEATVEDRLMARSGMHPWCLEADWEEEEER